MTFVDVRKNRLMFLLSEVFLGSIVVFGGIFLILDRMLMLYHPIVYSFDGRYGKIIQCRKVRKLENRLSPFFL